MAFDIAYCRLLELLQLTVLQTPPSEHANILATVKEEAILLKQQFH